MNAWEIVSYFRNMPPFSTEAKISTPELLRIVNIGYKQAIRVLSELVPSDLAMERNMGSFGGTDAHVYKPADTIKLMQVERETANGSGIYKKCTILAADKLKHVNDDPIYTATAAFPIAVEQSREIQIFPAFPVAPDLIGIKIQFIQTPPDLIFGPVLVTAAADTLTLKKTARSDNDAYNKHTMDIYETDVDGVSWFLSKNLRVSDYVGSSRLCTFEGPTGDDEFTANTEYFYATNPVLPAHTHDIILGHITAELIRSGKVQGNADAAMKEVAGREKLALEMRN